MPLGIVKDIAQTDRSNAHTSSHRAATVLATRTELPELYGEAKPHGRPVAASMKGSSHSPAARQTFSSNSSSSVSRRRPQAWQPHQEKEEERVSAGTVDG